MSPHEASEEIGARIESHGRRSRFTSGRSAVAVILLVSCLGPTVGCREATPPVLPAWGTAASEKRGSETSPGGAPRAVLTRESAMEPGRSILWCAAFEMAWRELCRAGGGPLEIRGAEAASAELNRTLEGARDLPATAAYATAGRVDEGILERIQGEMGSRFPGRPLPDLPRESLLPSGSIVAYAFLAAAVVFPVAYDRLGNDRFRNRDGSESLVDFFGVEEGDHSEEGKRRRRQVSILYRKGDAEDETAIVDPYPHSIPFQILLAKMPLRKCAREILAEVDRLAKGPARSLDDGAEFRVPTIDLAVRFDFDSLVGDDRRIVGPGPLADLFIALARQDVRFQMTRKGVTLEAEAVLAAAAAASEETDVGSSLRFDGPFVVIVRTRTDREPILVLCVEDSGVLVSRAGS